MPIARQSTIKFATVAPSDRSAVLGDENMKLFKELAVGPSSSGKMLSNK